MVGCGVFISGVPSWRLPLKWLPFVWPLSGSKQLFWFWFVLCVFCCKLFNFYICGLFTRKINVFTVFTVFTWLKRILNFDYLKRCKMTQFYLLTIITSPWLKKILNFDSLKCCRMYSILFNLSPDGIITQWYQYISSAKESRF